jgi:hypothetical protein
MKALNPLIPCAIQAVEKYLALPTQEVPKEYDGYAASFGASITTAGLLPTLSFFTDVHKIKTNDNPDQVRRYKLLQAIMHILDPDKTGREKLPENAMLFWAMKELYKTDVSNADVPLGQLDKQKLPGLEKQILQAAIALKLALRNFKQTEPTSANE